MKYRPKEWVNPYWSITEDVTEEQQKDILIFEAGADAILEALRKDGVACTITTNEGDESATIEFSYDYAINITKGKQEGILVFIPEE